MNLIGLITLFALGLVGCQTTKPMYVVRNKAVVVVEYYRFRTTISTDMNSSYKILDIKPLQLPYYGKIIRISAQERWAKLSEFALNRIKEDCHGEPSEKPEFRSAEADYKKFASSPDHPAYLQVKYRCG